MPKGKHGEKSDCELHCGDSCPSIDIEVDEVLKASNPQIRGERSHYILANIPGSHLRIDGNARDVAGARFIHCDIYKIVYQQTES